MAQSYSDAAVFASQKKAHKKFFEDELPSGFEPLSEEDRPSNTKGFKGKVYDITGFDGQQVVALLSQIVNDKDQYATNKTFYLLIRDSSEENPQAEFEELIKFWARPSRKQPGNAIVFMRPRGYKNFTQKAKNYDALNGALKAHYNTDTESFAKDLRKLLKDNTQNKGLPQATIEAYMILLFEIARRLAKAKKPSQQNDAFANLPIGSAIARLIKLLETGKYHFEDAFFPKGRFHCFTGKPEVRRKAIEEINEAHTDIEYPKKTRVTVNSTTFLLSKEATEERETKRQLQELQETFCPDKEEEELAQTLKDLKMRIGQERPGQSSRLLSTSNAERNSAFDHLE